MPRPPPWCPRLRLMTRAKNNPACRFGAPARDAAAPWRASRPSYFSLLALATSVFPRLQIRIQPRTTLPRTHGAPAQACPRWLRAAACWLAMPPEPALCTGLHLALITPTHVRPWCLSPNSSSYNQAHGATLPALCPAAHREMEPRALPCRVLLRVGLRVGFIGPSRNRHRCCIIVLISEYCLTGMVMSDLYMVPRCGAGRAGTRRQSR